MIAEPRHATVARRGAAVAVGHVGAAGVAPWGNGGRTVWCRVDTGRSIGSFIGDILHSGAMLCRIFLATGAQRTVTQLQLNFIAWLSLVDGGDHWRSVNRGGED